MFRLTAIRIRISLNPHVGFHSRRSLHAVGHLEPSGGSCTYLPVSLPLLSLSRCFSLFTSLPLCLSLSFAQNRCFTLPVLCPAGPGEASCRRRAEDCSMLLAQCLLARMLQRHGLPLRIGSRKAGVAAAHSFVILDGDRNDHTRPSLRVCSSTVLQSLASAATVRPEGVHAAGQGPGRSLQCVSIWSLICCSSRSPSHKHCVIDGVSSGMPRVYLCDTRKGPPWPCFGLKRSRSSEQGARLRSGPTPFLELSSPSEWSVMGRSPRHRPM